MKMDKVVCQKQHTQVDNGELCILLHLVSNCCLGNTQLRVATQSWLGSQRQHIEDKNILECATNNNCIYYMFYMFV